MPVKVAILWHMHQPNYQEPQSRRLVLPWVRLHAVKDYLDMPLAAARYDNVKVTFNLVPALIDQLQMYVDGGTDRHLELSRLPADQLSDDERQEILATFFAGNPPTMILPYPRLAELYQKYSNNIGDPVLPHLYTSEELRDLQVWSNLAWIDPTFRDKAPLRELFDKGRHFTEADKHGLLDWEIKLLGRIVPTYRDLFQQGRIDVSFTPFYHPILPLLCDTDVAREAIPGIALPTNPFRHPEDARKQIEMSQAMYRELFDRPMVGMWPSEGSVSEEVARLCLDLGLEWIATDEEILQGSFRKSSVPAPDRAAYAIYDHGPGLKMFFRDHGLSDRIGFVYSSWDPERAVRDFIGHIKEIGRYGGEDTVVPIILDGENAWEYYSGDGEAFLDQLYRGLAEDSEIETVTMTEAARSVPARPLPRLFAGSWINHNFRIWIGHHEDNAAWDLLSAARDTLVQFEQDHADYDPTRLKAAWRQIYIAEGSDWCWWYGDEHRGDHNGVFDTIFRRHLMAVYELLELDLPANLFVPIHQGETRSLTVLPEATLTPTLDGRVTHFYEWAGAGFFDCTGAGGAMHRVDRSICCIYFVYDDERLYIRLDFDDINVLQSLKKPGVQFTFYTPDPVRVSVPLSFAAGQRDESGRYEFAMDQILEIGFPRDQLLTGGAGKLGFSVVLADGRQKLETWPDGVPISLEIYDRGKELFWP